MSAANNVVFIGRPTRDAELKTDTLATFAIAVNKTYRDKSGERRDQVDFFDMILGGSRAKALYQYIKKGRLLGFRCEARNNSFVDMNGNKRTQIQFVVLDVEFIPVSTGQGQAHAQSQPAQLPAAKVAPSPEAMETPAAQFAAAPYADDDIPF